MQRSSAPPLLLLLLSAMAHSEDPPQQWHYELGGASLVRKGPWHASETQQLNAPMFTARYGGWQFGLEHGLVSYHWRSSGVQLRTGLGLRDESVNSQLWGDARDERYEGYDGGALEATANAGITWKQFSLDAQQDISGESNGMAATALVTLPLYAWPGRFTPKAQWYFGARWLSRNYSQSVFGVEEKHATAQLPAYTTEDAVNPQLGVRLMWPFTEQWQMRFMYSAEWLDSDLRDSPLVGRNMQHTGLLTFTYRL